MIQVDNIFLKHYHPEVKTSLQKLIKEIDPGFIYRFIVTIWSEIINGDKYITLEPDRKLLLPFKLIGVGLTKLNFGKRNSTLFLAE